MASKPTRLTSRSPASRRVASLCTTVTCTSNRGLTRFRSAAIVLTVNYNSQHPAAFKLIWFFSVNYNMRISVCSDSITHVSLRVWQSTSASITTGEITENPVTVNTTIASALFAYTNNKFDNTAMFNWVAGEAGYVCLQTIDGVRVRAPVF